MPLFFRVFFAGAASSAGRGSAFPHVSKRWKDMNV